MSKTAQRARMTRPERLFKLNIYIVKLGFTGVYNIFIISAQNIDCW